MKKVRKFKDKKLTIRFLEKADVKKAALFKDYINELVEDDTALITKKTKVNLREEKEWLKDDLKKMKGKKKVMLVAEDKGKIIAISEVYLNKHATKEHVANFAISIIKGYRSIGLGTYLMREVIQLARERLRPRPKMLTFGTFAVNKRAISLYKKMGCKQVARISKQFKLKGKFYDEIIMLKYL